MNLPELAISVRQPWAWAIIHAGKDIENRDWRPGSIPRSRAPIGKRVCIHAAQGLTKAEYEDAAELITKLAGRCPLPHELIRGAVIGTVAIADRAIRHDSPWFFGPFGLVLASPEPIIPIRATGELGWFKWKPCQEPWPALAKWMKPIEPEPQIQLIPPDPYVAPRDAPTIKWSSERDVTDWKPDPTAGSTEDKP